MQPEPFPNHKITGTGENLSRGVIFPQPAKVAHLLCQCPTGRRTTIEDVRYYTTKPMNGGTTFKCIFCEHKVTTLDFNSANGNHRTQAATAINRHVASAHSRASRTTL